MPQSLMLGESSSSSSSAKRQRSVDSREVPTRPTSAGRNRSSLSLSKPNVRIPRYLDKSKIEIASAFQDLEWKQRFRLFHAIENPTTSPFRVDRSDVVISRNRYGNVQPWDNSRVKLHTPIGGSDYVNASPIALRSRLTPSSAYNSPYRGDGYEGAIHQETKYVATQGPKPGHLSHFWHMVLQETTGDVGVIVMLTQCYEANKEKCAQYFPANMNDPTIILPKQENSPEEEGENAAGNEGDFWHGHPVETQSGATSEDSVTLKSLERDASTGSELRVLDLTVNGQSKTIHHYLYYGWPDFGKPEADDRVALVELTRRTKEVAGDSPRIVHCSAGVGRTGTFIALDFLTREIEDGRIFDTVINSSSNHLADLRENVTPTSATETWGKSGPPKVKTPTTDLPSGEDNHALKDDLIYEVVNLLREQRMMMVMNELQYAFLYEVIRDVFLEKYKARPEGVVVRGAEQNAQGHVEPGEARDLPKGKVAKVIEAGHGSGGMHVAEDSANNGDGDSASEAETEIMESDSIGNKARMAEQQAELENDKENDPYNVVAPEHLREGVSVPQQQ